MSFGKDVNLLPSCLIYNHLKKTKRKLLSASGLRLTVLQSDLKRHVRFPETEKISPPLLQLSDVGFGYIKEKIILKGVNFDVGLDSRIAIVGSNGAGKSTL